MSIRALERMSAAAALAVALLVVPAAPASAALHDVALTNSGTVTLHNPSTLVTGVGHISNAFAYNCAANSPDPSILPVNFNSNGGGTIAAVTTKWFDLTGFTTPALKARMVITAGSVTLTTAPPAIFVTLVMTLEFRTCASTTHLCTSNTINITMTGANSTSTLHPMAVTNFDVTGTQHITFGIGCNAGIRGSFNSTTLTVNLKLQVTT